MTTRRLLASIALYFFLFAGAQAQTGRPELEHDGGTLLLIALVYCGVAFFHCRAQLRRSQVAGEAAVVAWTLVGLLAVGFPPIRLLVAIIVVCFLVYGFCRVT